MVPHHTHYHAHAVQTRVYTCNSHSGSARLPWTRSSSFYLKLEQFKNLLHFEPLHTMTMHEAGSPVFLAVNLSMVTLAVVTGAVASLHAAACPSPTGVVVPALHRPLADAVRGF